MVWITIILSILSALPQLISLIQEIWGAIHNKPAQLHALMGLLLKHQDVNAASTDEAKAAAEADLRAFHAVHVLGQPAA